MAEYTGGGVTTYYVNGGTAEANDTFSGTVPFVSGRGAGPWATIQKAFDKIADGTIVDGDEVRIMASGTYTITSPLTCSWSSAEVVITGANPDTVLVDGSVAKITTSNGITMMFSNVATIDQTVFANLHFDGNDNATSCLHQTVANSHNCHFINCRFSQSAGHGVVVDTSNYWNFTNCRFDNNAGSGLTFGASHFGIIYKSLFDNNGGHGAQLKSFYRCTESVFYGNSGCGVFSAANNGGVLINNIYDSNHDDGLYIQGSGQSIHVGNIYSNNGQDGSGNGIVVGTGTEVRVFNSIFYGNDDQWGYTTGVDHLCIYNSLTGGSNPSYLQPAGPTFDFTPASTFSGIGTGIPTHYAWFGGTADDIGLNKWKSSESISVF